MVGKTRPALIKRIAEFGAEGSTVLKVKFLDAAS